jgi:hypothetical protein
VKSTGGVEIIKKEDLSQLLIFKRHLKFSTFWTAKAEKTSLRTKPELALTAGESGPLGFMLNLSQSCPRERISSFLLAFFPQYIGTHMAV